LGDRVRPRLDDGAGGRGALLAGLGRTERDRTLLQRLVIQGDIPRDSLARQMIFGASTAAGQRQAEDDSEWTKCIHVFKNPCEIETGHGVETPPAESSTLPRAN